MFIYGPKNFIKAKILIKMNMRPTRAVKICSLRTFFEKGWPPPV